MMIGLLVALTIGPNLDTNTNLSLAVRLSSVALLAIGTGGRVASELRSGSAGPAKSQTLMRCESSKPAAAPEKVAA